MKRNLNEQVLKPAGAPDWVVTLFSLTHSGSIIRSFITIGPHSCLWSRNNAILQMLRLLGPEELVKWIIFLNQKRIIFTPWICTEPSYALRVRIKMEPDEP